MRYMVVLKLGCYDLQRWASLILHLVQDEEVSKLQVAAKFKQDFLDGVRCHLVAAGQAPPPDDDTVIQKSKEMLSHVYGGLMDEIPHTVINVLENRGWRLWEH